MYTISKEFSFSASHQLKGLRDGHPCMRLHGHNYRVELILAAKQLNDHGFVEDYNDLKPFGDYLDRYLDHRHLNEIFEQPTAEIIAKHLYEVARNFLFYGKLTVRVSETPKTWASYTEEENV